MPKKKVVMLDAHVGLRVRMGRLLIGISQKRLSESLGLTFQQIQKYEKGRNRISAGRLFEIAGILGMPISFFFEDIPSGTSGSSVAIENESLPITELLSSNEGLRLGIAFVQIKDAKVKRRVFDLVHSLADMRTTSPPVA